MTPHEPVQSGGWARTEEPIPRMTPWKETALACCVIALAGIPLLWAVHRSVAAWRPESAKSASVLRPPPTVRCLHTGIAPVIDGRLAEWHAHSAPVEVGDRDVRYGRETHHGREDLSGTIRFAWDDEALYVAVRVTDDVVRLAPSVWQGDHIEIYLDTRYEPGATGPFGPGQFQIGVRPDGVIESAAPDGLDLSSVRAAMTRTAAGYDCEIRVPWTLLGIAPEPGMTLGVDACISDSDLSDRQEALSTLIPGPWVWQMREHMAPMILVSDDAT